MSSNKRGANLKGACRVKRREMMVTTVHVSVTVETTSRLCVLTLEKLKSQW